MSHTTASQEAPQRGLLLPSPEEIAQLPPDGGEHYNRLIFEQSPYLLQHATNPVDWRPWGEAAFQAAREQNRPIFLSIGYATCHWCHVMEHESFEDPTIGALINEHFIPIKVDREERPDIDHIHMQVTQAMTGHGGWPMTVVMTPDREPFFAGTYFPPRMTFGRPGLTELIPRLSQAWRDQREDIARSAQEITRFLERASSPASGEMLTTETLGQARMQLAQRYDATHGGFGMAPKFPTPHNLMFLLREWRRTGDEEPLLMVTNTLRRMRMGGVYDQVGFGYHRYSTDREWLLPHFEKMLYDNALMVIANTEAHLAMGDEEFARTAREIVAYVLRDMTSPEGGFYSAEDADSEGEEGKFYVWSAEEVRSLLGEDAALFMRVYQIEEEGNFHEEATGRAAGMNIPHLTESIATNAEQMAIPEGDLRARLERSRQTLFEARERRVHPLLDDKVLTDWNGLMIAALAISGRGLREPEHTRAAVRAADFVLDHLRDGNGRLLKRSRLGEAGLPGLLDDHAFLVWGLIELYETTYDPRHLANALGINALMLEHFWDDANGGLFLTPDDGERLLVRPKEIYDGAAPSGNSVAALNLLRLARMTGDSSLEERAERIIRAFAPQVEQAAGAHTFLMMALQFAVGDSREVVIAGEPGADATQAMIDALHSRFLPQVVTVLRPDGDAPVVDLAPFTANQDSQGGQATAYVCRNHACDAPTTSVETMLQSLSR